MKPYSKAETVKIFCDRVARGGFDGASEALDPEIEWKEPSAPAPWFRGPHYGTEPVRKELLETMVAELAAEPTRILLADDETDLWWDQCLAALARSGYHVDTAEDGEAAWEALQSYHYDLLITDNKMPKVSGLELITNLRAQGMALPIIFASSLLPRITPEQKPYFLNVHLLEKPVAPSQLLATIDHVALVHAGSRQPSVSDHN